MAAMSQYDKQRVKKTPPHVSLRSLRKATDQTLEQVCASVSDILNLPVSRPFTRGALSAIENGHRGASAPVLNALAIAYGLDPGDIVTDFVPRENNDLAPAV